VYRQCDPINILVYRVDLNDSKLRNDCYKRIVVIVAVCPMLSAEVVG